GPGRIVCCAAGNEGNDNIHAQVVVARNSTRTIACSIPFGPPGFPGVPGVFNGWYEGGDRLEVAVVPPTGAQTPYQPVITSGSPNRTYQLPHGTVRVVTPGPDPTNGDHNFFVLIQPSVTPPPAPKPNTWRIRVRGQRITKGGRLDVWAVDWASLFSGQAVQDRMKVGSPGAATSALSVGSYTTKVEWEDFFGNPQSAGLDLDDISDFSSEGPRRDGVKKPDLVAPGAMIVSALGVHAPTPQSVIVDDNNRVMAGTSMACPFAAGLVALLLERDPGLDPKGLKELLRKHTSIPRKRAGTFDPKWGYGLIDATDL
ncbi:MAG: S8 family serine peptidase, partial [Actinobacteria bacterium]|nr:S8 family serine peptidase [Actinomycetota bacterium]